MPPKKSKRELARADLPVDVWARVAAYMSLQEWAKVSGTCRSTRAVRLKNLTIKNTPGVQWASRMLDGAEALSLSVDSLQEIAQGVMCGLYSINQLQQLVVVAEEFSDPALSCLSWLLPQVAKLKVLVTPAGSRPWFPPLATLKHLDLTFHRDVGNFCKAMPCFTGLETLSLSSQDRPGGHALRIGDLEKMGDLPHLRVCVLKAIEPDLIMVPKACRLHIGVSVSSDIGRSVWRGVLSNIHSINITFSHPDAISLDSFQIKVVSPLPRLRILNIQVHSAHPVFDLKCLAQFEKLRISGRDVAVRLPAGVCWDALELNATGKLMLEFEDLNGFPAAVPRFAASYGNLHGTQVLKLFTTLAQNGIKCGYDEENQSKFMFWYPAEERPVGCWCGACLDCLVASGQAVGHAAEVEKPVLVPDPVHMYHDIHNGFGGYGPMHEEGLYGEEDEEEDIYDEDLEEQHAAALAALEEEEEQENMDGWGYM